MFENPIFLLGLSTVFAAIPAAIWLYIFFKKSEKSKKTIFLIFGLGCLTAPALLGLQVLWEKFPRFNLAALVEDSFAAQSTMYIFMFVLFGAMEEIIKLYVIKTVDQRTLLIDKINDAIRYSLAAALGFSFTENIYYLYEFWPSISTGELVQMYIFRSIFTACAHMIFSGVFGYFYGVGKFSIVLMQHEKLLGEENKIQKFIAKIFNLPMSEGFRQASILKGLLLAIGMHATFNYLLQFNKILPVIIFVVLGFIFLRYLLSRKAGHLILTIDPSTSRPSTIAKKDSDVVVELLGIWFKDKHYVDVLHVCERLLERDPDNSVVKLFKARAMDAMDDKDTYKKILGTVVKTKDDLSENQKNVISRYTTEKEMFQKVKQMIKKQIEKEGKKFVEPQTKALPIIMAPAQNTQIQQKAATSSAEITAPQAGTPQTTKPQNIVEKYSGDGTFQLKI